MNKLSRIVDRVENFNNQEMLMLDLALALFMTFIVSLLMWQTPDIVMKKIYLSYLFGYYFRSIILHYRGRKNS